MGYPEIIIGNINIDHEWNRKHLDCPIKLDKIHCQNCHFAPNGKCEYESIMALRHSANRKGD